MILLLSSLPVSQSLVLHRRSARALRWTFAAAVVVVVQLIVGYLVWLVLLCLLLAFPVFDATPLL